MIILIAPYRHRRVRNKIKKMAQRSLRAGHRHRKTKEIRIEQYLSIVTIIRISRPKINKEGVDYHKIKSNQIRRSTDHMANLIKEMRVQLNWTLWSNRSLKIKGIPWIKMGIHFKLSISYFKVGKGIRAREMVEGQNLRRKDLLEYVNRIRLKLS